jgi:hypothetical protein
MATGPLINALVIECNGTIYWNPSTNTYGTPMLIPAESAEAFVDGDYYASPVTNWDVFEGGYTKTAVSASFSPLPNPNCFPVVRISTRNRGEDYWVIVGASYQYHADSLNAQCCGNAAAQLPTTVQSIYPCQLLCWPNANGLYQGTYAAPNAVAGKNYYAAGFFNGVALTPLSNAGYSTLAALITAMNASWSNVGTWSQAGSPPTILVAEHAGTGSDVLCIRIWAQ